VADGSSEQLKASMNKRMKVKMQLTAPPEAVENMITELGNIQLAELKQLDQITSATVEFDSINDRRPDIFNYIKNHNWLLYELHRDDVSLEAVFRNLTIEGGK
jgi:ABC-type transporter Mla subunit MlaD